MILFVNDGEICLILLISQAGYPPGATLGFDSGETIFLKNRSFPFFMIDSSCIDNQKRLSFLTHFEELLSFPISHL